MADLFAAFSLDTIIIVLCLAIPALIKGIMWICKTIKAANVRRKELRNEGAQELMEEQEIEERFEAGEDRIADLEKEEAKLTQILKNQ